MVAPALARAAWNLRRPVLERRETCEMTQFLAKVGTTTGEIEELALTADSESVLRDELNDADSQRAVDIISFTTNLEHVGDIVDKNLLELANKKAEHRAKRG